jgi:acid stress-induced BolA-like protein IbaG/YrbA
MEQDVSDMLWMLLGTALHVVAERSEVDGHTNEERLSVDINDIVLSGAIDLQKNDADGITITDYKFTSAWALMHDKPEWEQQQNIYKYLVERVKKTPVKALKICAFVRDWSRREAEVKPSYPQSQIQVIDIPMWTFDRTEYYIKERIEMHRDSKVSADWNEELPLCTEEDRWVRETKYALNTEEEAKVMLKELPEKDKAFIEIRKGEAVRCTGNYCGVSQWCSQYQATLKEATNDNE